MSKNETRVAALEAHVRRFWDGHIIEPATWDSGPVIERLPYFSSYRILPIVAGGAWVYVTVGASVDIGDIQGVEFLIMSPWADSVHSETLAMVSHFNSYDAHRLDVGSIVNIGRPWMDDSRMDHLLVSLPYSYGPGLEWAPPEAGGARFLWLLPIHKGEADFVRNNGLERFEEILDARQINILEVDRRSVV